MYATSDIRAAFLRKSALPMRRIASPNPATVPLEGLLRPSESGHLARPNRKIQTGVPERVYPRPLPGHERDAQRPGTAAPRGVSATPG